MRGIRRTMVGLIAESFIILLPNQIKRHPKGGRGKALFRKLKTHQCAAEKLGGQQGIMRVSGFEEIRSRLATLYSQATQ